MPCIGITSQLPVTHWLISAHSLFRYSSRGQIMHVLRVSGCTQYGWSESRHTTETKDSGDVIHHNPKRKQSGEGNETKIEGEDDTQPLPNFGT